MKIRSSGTSSDLMLTFTEWCERNRIGSIHQKILPHPIFLHKHAFAQYITFVLPHISEKM